MNNDHGASYEAAGVDYTTLDAAKRVALAAAAATSVNPARLGAVVLDRSRGEPAVVISLGDTNLGFVLECLGTKSMIAREFATLTGVDRFAAIGYDTVAAAVNDCCCVGALPFVVNAYFATGAASFYAGDRHERLVAGFRAGCDAAGAAWGGGESPTLAGLIGPADIDLAASAVGLVPAGVRPVLGERLGPGDEIVFISSSGLHANGASLVRAITGELDQGLATLLPSGRSFGEAVLDPSIIYVRLVESLFANGVEVHYLSHITGHGLRKVMRAATACTYRITDLPKVPEALAFLVQAAKMNDHAAYGTLNMGVGFAVYVAKGEGERVVRLARGGGLDAMVAGRVEEGPRQVILEPLDVTFSSDQLDLRSSV